MTSSKKIEMWYSIQSDYCYFLLDRLLRLSSLNVEIVIRPVLGIVLRMPEAIKNRSELEQQYFLADTKRTADYLGLPYSYPNPSPIQFEPDNVWVASKEQPHVEKLNRLFVGATRAGKGLQFLDVIVRGLWNGTQINWDTSTFLHESMDNIGLDHEMVLTSTPWADALDDLTANHEAMLETGHWGVPLIAYEGEPFYGQDRFDQLLWRMKIQMN